MLYMADAYMGKAHVTAGQIGDYNAGVSGSGCVLNVGEKLRAEIINANLVRIYDGAFIFQGYRRSGITAGSYEDVTIENGTQAQKRNDLICAKYEKDSTTSKENLTLVVINGTPGDTASDPEIPEGDVRSGSAVCYMPLYRVRLDGINLAAVEKLFTVRKNIEEIEGDVAALNNKLSNILLSVYPVGSIYMSIKNVNPSSLFGGTWVSWGSGRVPVGVNTSDSDFNSVEKTGGSKTVSLTESNLPSHKHSVNAVNISSSGAHTHSTTAKTIQNALRISDATMGWGPNQRSGGGNSATTAINVHDARSFYIDIPSLSIPSSGSHTHSVPSHNTNSTGSGTAFTNLQPYITCYMWKRTA